MRTAAELEMLSPIDVRTEMDQLKEAFVRLACAATNVRSARTTYVTHLRSHAAATREVRTLIAKFYESLDLVTLAPGQDLEAIPEQDREVLLREEA